MKLLRVGVKGKEKPAALDKNGKIRDWNRVKGQKGFYVFGRDENIAAAIK